MKKQAKITGTGSYLPEKRLTNSDLEQMVETTNEWITSRTGIEERRLAAATEFTSNMGTEAARIALKKAQIAPEDVDLILCATITPDHIFPSTACLIQSQLGATNAASFDVQAACSGMVYALSMAKAYIEAGMYKNILIVASEKLSSIVDYEDRSTCILFGDGAAACLVSSEGKGMVIERVNIGSDGDQSALIQQPAGGSRCPATAETVAAKDHVIKMEGREVFKHAVRRMESAAKACLEQENLTKSDLKWLVAHQANIRIIDAMASRFGIPKERVYTTIHKYGNTSASSVGIVLSELKDRNVIEGGDRLLIVAFGAGLTWGAALLREETANE